MTQSPTMDFEEARARARVRANLFGEPLEPMRLGRFIVIERLGAGAMGVVYVAYDPRLDRKVAIKILRSKSASAAGQERLLLEAQALAKLSHPNVVAVHEVGMVDNRVFIAMEFIDGVTLRSWLAERPRSFDERLSKLTDAGRGLEAAHAAGWVHGDFKPDNVLIDHSGRVRVVDFGLARPGPTTDPAFGTKEDSSQTPQPYSSGTTVDDSASVDRPRRRAPGTPAYMAPEQYDGQRTEYSDQFSFCATAYETLFNVRPFDGRSRAELHQNVRQRRIQPPSKGVTVPRRVRAAVLRGLSPAPTERFDSMEALLTELDRSRRRPMRTILGASAMAALGALLSAVLLAPKTETPCAHPSRMLDSVWTPARQAQFDRVLRATQTPNAANLAQTVTDTLSRQVAAWRTMEKRACEATHVHRRQSEVVLRARMLCLTSRARELRALSDQLLDVDSTSVKRVRSALSVLVDVSVCGDPEYLRARVAPPTDPDVRKVVSDLEQRLLRSRVMTYLAQHDKSLLLAQQVYTDAQQVPFEPIKAAAATRLGQCEAWAGNLETAERHLHEGARRGLKSGNVLAMAEAWDLLSYVSVSLQGDFTSAIRFSKYALALTPSIGERPATVAAINGRLGWVYTEMGEFEAAFEYLARAKSLREQHLGADHPETAYSNFYYARALSNAGRCPEAEPLFLAADAVFEKIFVSNKTMLNNSRHDRACCYRDTGRLDEAHPIMASTHAFYVERYGEDHLWTAYVLVDLGRLWLRSGQPKRARPFITKAVETFLKQRGASHADYGQALAVKGELLLAEGALPKAGQVLKTSLRIMEARLGKDTYRQFDALEALAQVEESRRRYSEALALYERLLTAFDGLYGSGHVYSTRPLTGLARVLSKLGRNEEARAFAVRAEVVMNAQ